MDVLSASISLKVALQAFWIDLWSSVSSADAQRSLGFDLLGMILTGQRE